MIQVRFSNMIENRDVKMYFTCILAAIFVSIICILFRIVLSYVEMFRNYFFEWAIFPLAKCAIYTIFTFLVLLWTASFIRLNPVLSGNGAEQTRGMLNGHIPRAQPLKQLFEKWCVAIITLGCGMSLGREGPSIQFGGYVGIFTSRLCHLTLGREEYIISAGSSAGIAAALNSPLGGPIYIVESLQKVNNIRMAVCALLGGMTGGLLANLILPYNPYISISITFPDLDKFRLFAVLLGMGLYMALLSLIFTQCVIWLRKHFPKGLFNGKFNILLFVVGMGLLGMYIPDMLGSGQPFMIKEITNLSNTSSTLTLYMILFFIFTIISQGSNFPGGAFLPMLTVGGLSGAVFCDILHQWGLADTLNRTYFMFLGMSSAFVVVMRTPLTGFILVAEITGRYDVLFPSLIVGIAGYALISIVRMQSLTQALYQQMLNAIGAKEGEYITIYMEVMPNSYIEGQIANQAGMPNGCVIDNVLRKGKPVDLSTRLIQGDEIQFKIETAMTEKVYQSLLSFCTYH